MFPALRFCHLPRGRSRARRPNRRRGLRSGLRVGRRNRRHPVAAPHRRQGLEQVMLERRDLVKFLLADRRDLLVVSGLGAPTYDVAAAGDHPLNFYLWGAMGGAAMMGLGLALAQPKRHVAVITGDGEM